MEATRSAIRTIGLKPYWPTNYDNKLDVSRLRSLIKNPNKQSAKQQKNVNRTVKNLGPCFHIWLAGP
nr:MAG TPA: hypothetical protein [Caudoviricetes sp.]